MKYLIVTMLMLVILGCNEEKIQVEVKTVKEETKTVEWYKNNSAERKAKLKECANNPGELKESPNCINAKKATALSLTEKPATNW